MTARLNCERCGTPQKMRLLRQVGTSESIYECPQCKGETQFFWPDQDEGDRRQQAGRGW